MLPYNVKLDSVHVQKLFLVKTLLGYVHSHFTTEFSGTLNFIFRSFQNNILDMYVYLQSCLSMWVIYVNVLIQIKTR